ncbi:NmrA family NAD(P)-binding protein [Larkinella knui]|uniref:NAD-dependent epimerase/dehydratase family protein n=1 Tax=Larkinella knui TaxID=2025310 RepID=A0A3P1CQ56_9BACT|nr:NAD(P)H-binding protein [Larkinella knui]RRB15462.1 NAD-dependent epimerase/dehydratase family protein [Larkinella knui]
MKIIITGSVGHISKPLAKALVQNGHTVAVISSNPEKQKDIEALGATAAIGSLEDVDFLTTTLAGADAVYCMVPPKYTEPDLRAYYRRIGRNYASAIRQTGTKRVVNLSSYGADLDKGTGIILGAHDVEGLLNELPEAAITHLRPTYFYYNLYNFVDMIKTLGFIGANYGGDDRLVMVDPADIAAVVAEELTRPASGQTVRYIASDERTASETARCLGEAIGKPDLKWVLFTDEQVRSRMEANGMSAQFAADFADLGASIHSGAMRQDYDRHQPTDIGKVKLEDFAKEFAATYSKA